MPLGDSVSKSPLFRADSQCLPVIPGGQSVPVEKERWGYGGKLRLLTLAPVFRRSAGGQSPENPRKVLLRLKTTLGGDIDDGRF